MEAIKRKSIKAVEESSSNNDAVQTLKEKNIELEKQSETLNETITTLKDKVDKAEEEERMSLSNIAALTNDLNLKLEEMKGSDTELKGVINEVQGLRKELAKMCNETKDKSNDSAQLIDMEEDENEGHDKVNAVKLAGTPAKLDVSKAGNTQIIVLCNDIKSMRDQMQKTTSTFISKIKSQTAQVTSWLVLLMCSVLCVMNVTSYDVLF
jgi:DNA repair exonuclease SbcCD ATPase subunit